MYMRGKLPIFGYKDTWNMNDTLAPIICAGIKKFKTVITDDRHPLAKGTPCDVLYTLFPNHKDYTFTDEQSEAGWQEWLKILDKMIYAFDNKEPDINRYEFEFVYNSEGNKRDEDGYTPLDMNPIPKEEYNRYCADEKEHEECVKEGLSLFAQYFHMLWW